MIIDIDSNEYYEITNFSNFRPINFPISIYLSYEDIFCVIFVIIFLLPLLPLQLNSSTTSTNFVKFLLDLKLPFLFGLENIKTHSSMGQEEIEVG